MVFSLFGPTLVNLVAFLYPAYCAHKALAASKGKEEKTADVRKWLCYFTTIALVSQVEFVTSWLPGYYLFKFVGVLYLVLPQFNGIETVYTKFVEPFLVQHEKTIDDGIVVVTGLLCANFGRGVFDFLQIALMKLYL